MSGTITSTHDSALTLTSAQFADPVTNFGTISLTTAGTALYAASGWTVVNEALIAAVPSAGSHGILLAAGGAVTNAAGATVAGGGGIDIGGAAGAVLNAGLLQGSNDAGVELDAGGYVSNAATAEITGGTRAVSIAGAPGQVFNAGLITDTTRGAVVLADGGSVTNAATGTIASNGTLGSPVGAGVKLYGGVGAVTNAGAIYSGNAAGVAVYAGGTVSNAAHGTIAGYIGVYALTVAPVIVNAGYIAGTRSTGVFLGGGGAVTNLAAATIAGVLSGIYGLPGGAAPSVVNDGVVLSTSKSGIALFAGGTVVNQAQGTISGYLSGIHFESGGGTLVNAGTVGPAHGANAAVTFAAGYANRLVVEPGAVFLGRVLGGNTIGAAATSTLELAAGAGTLAGIGASLVDFAAITFDPGAAWLLAGGTDALAGGETIAGFAGGDTIELTGTVESFSGFASGRLTLSGGSTLVLPGAVPIVTSSGGNTFITDEVATITGTHVAGVTLTSTVYADPVTVGSGATIAATAVSREYGVYAASAWTVANEGLIAATGNVAGKGIFLADGGLVSNAGGATISGAAIGIVAFYDGTVSNAVGGVIAATAVGIRDVFGPGLVVNGGLISGGTYTRAFGVDLQTGGVVSNAAGGTIVAAGSASVGVSLFGVGTVVNAGTIGGGAYAVSFGYGYTGDRLVADPGAVFLGKVDGGGYADKLVSTLELASGSGIGTLSGLGSSFVGFGTIAFDAGAQWFVAGSGTNFPSVTIAGFASADTIELTGTVENYGALAGGMLTLSGGTTLDMPGLAGARVTSDGSNSFITACFASGTSIVTARGVVRVEALREGELVVTATGRLAPVRWIGHRRVELRRHPSPHDVMPVRVRAGAFGLGLPVRDLVLSPDHAVFVDGYLVPIRHLINGVSIVQEVRANVTYWHVELDRHDVILAEGLACESYLDTGNRSAFEGEAAVMLHADFARAVWDAEGCAPILTDPADARLRALHTRLLIGTPAARVARGVRFTRSASREHLGSGCFAG